MFSPSVFDVTLAGVLLRAAPRPPAPIPVTARARAYGLTRDQGSVILLAISERGCS